MENIDYLCDYDPEEIRRQISKPGAKYHSDFRSFGDMLLNIFCALLRFFIKIFHAVNSSQIKYFSASYNLFFCVSL